MFTEDEHAGRKVRCPNCKGIIIVPGERLVPVRRDRGPRDEDEADADRPESKGGVSTQVGLGRARIGLGLHWGKTLAFLIVAAFGLLASLVLFIVTLVGASSRAGAEGSATAATTVLAAFSCVGIIALFVMPVLSAVGSLMCFWLPQRSGGRVLSMVGCGLDAAAFLFLLVGTVMYFAAVASTAGGRGPPSLDSILMTGGIAVVLYGLMYLLMLAGWILHMLVLRNLAAYVRNRYAAADALRMLIIGVVVLVAPAILLWLFSWLLLPRTGRAGVLIGEFLMIAWSGGLLAVSFRLLNLITTVRRRL
jgi:hypothetical protein